MKVIFLDIDGVLNCATSYSSCSDDELGTITGIDTDKVKRLSEIVNKTGAKIVLSSTWRYGWEKTYKNYEEKPSHARYLDKHLYKKGGIFIYDKTKDIDWYSRGEEIKEWVCRYNPDSWVVLDDESFPDYYGNPYIEGHFVKTSWEYGIRDKDVDRAIEILNGGN